MAPALPAGIGRLVLGKRRWRDRFGPSNKLAGDAGSNGDCRAARAASRAKGSEPKFLPARSPMASGAGPMPLHGCRRSLRSSFARD